MGGEPSVGAFAVGKDFLGVDGFGEPVNGGHDAACHHGFHHKGLGGEAGGVGESDGACDVFALEGGGGLGVVGDVAQGDGGVFAGLVKVDKGVGGFSPEVIINGTRRIKPKPVFGRIILNAHSVYL